jgi:hypothetical protein
MDPIRKKKIPAGADQQFDHLRAGRRRRCEYRPGHRNGNECRQDGMLLRTNRPIHSQYLFMVSTDPNDRLIEIVGKAVFSARNRVRPFEPGFDSKAITPQCQLPQDFDSSLPPASRDRDQKADR